IGPGASDWRTPEASAYLGSASDWVGYGLYLDLAGPMASRQTRHQFDLGEEEIRVRHALELAGTGKRVALVCSGDAGIYAMASLAFELIDTDRHESPVSAAARRAEIVVSPGISAFQAASARAGAPFGHDFCTISLSNLLTPWEVIEQRVNAAAQGDFVIAFYNPVSKRRRWQLETARDILLKHRPPDTPVIIASNLGRKEEKLTIIALEDLVANMVDMLTLVIVGSSETHQIKTGSGQKYVYTPRGYRLKKQESAAE
ncbi:MAG: precorrin-3B C(17)-methyltransferase, partial [Fimbriimonadaceae bacterium]|nr:precorrin-3B C(17)-methyltransferase [Alphaproteobacteria bacterium]